MPWSTPRWSGRRSLSCSCSRSRGWNLWPARTDSNQAAPWCKVSNKPRNKARRGAFHHAFHSHGHRRTKHSHTSPHPRARGTQRLRQRLSREMDRRGVGPGPFTRPPPPAPPQGLAWKHWTAWPTVFRRYPSFYTSVRCSAKDNSRGFKMESPCSRMGDRKRVRPNHGHWSLVIGKPQMLTI